MKSAILEKGERYFTNMNKVFQAMQNEQLNYNWLITDCECTSQDAEIQRLFSKNHVWISGEELTNIVEKERFQFIWAVFSGFSIDVSLEDVLSYELPFADGNKGFWVDDVKIQHPLANIEIIAWDSSLTIFMSQNDDLVDKFMQYFPFSQNLSTKNTRDNAEIAYIENLLIKYLNERNITINEENIHKKYFFGTNCI